MTPEPTLARLGDLPVGTPYRSPVSGELFVIIGYDPLRTQTAQGGILFPLLGADQIVALLSATELQARIDPLWRAYQTAITRAWDAFGTLVDTSSVAAPPRPNAPLLSQLDTYLAASQAAEDAALAHGTAEATHQQAARAYFLAQAAYQRAIAPPPKENPTP